MRAAFLTLLWLARASANCPPRLVPVREEDCPDEGGVRRPTCDDERLLDGELCLSDAGECGTDRSLDNCVYPPDADDRTADVYRVVAGYRPTSRPTVTPDDDAPPDQDDVDAGATPRPTTEQPTPCPGCPTYGPTRVPTTLYEPTRSPTTESSTRPARLFAKVYLERVAANPFKPSDKALDVVARAVSNAVDVCDGPASVVAFDVTDVEDMFRRRRRLRGSDARRLQRGQYSYEAQLGVTCDADTCAGFGFPSNDACLDSMVRDLDKACKSGALASDLKIFANSAGLAMSPFLRADGVVDGSAAWSERGGSSSKKKKKKHELSTGVYVFLIVLAVLLGLCCLCFIASACARRKGKSRELQAEDFRQAFKAVDEETKDGFEMGEWDNRPGPQWDNRPGPRYVDDDGAAWDDEYYLSDDYVDDHPQSPLPVDPFARAAVSTAKSRKALLDGATRDDYADAAAARADFENHVRKLWERKAAKEVAHVSVALAAQERGLAEAKARKAKRDERVGLEARLAERRRRLGRSGSA